MNLSKFETILAINKGKCSRWTPLAVDSFRTAVKINPDFETHYPLRSDICYSFQYLQYIQLQLEELNLTDVVLAMLRKTYVITSLGIIEALFVYLLKSTNNWFSDRFSQVDKQSTNAFEYKGKKRKMEVITLEKTATEDEWVDFDTIINRISEKKLLKFKYGTLKDLKELRNKVHLQKAKSSKETDYNVFSNNVFIWTRIILYEILSSEKLVNDIAVFDFLNPTKEERDCAQKNPITARTKEK